MNADEIKWVKCEERKPPDSQDVVCFWSDHVPMDICHYVSDNDQWFFVSSGEEPDVEPMWWLEGLNEP